MRNPERLDNFYKRLCEIHKKHFPDWRFGQLISNFFGWIYSEKKRDIFFPEEDEMIDLLKDYIADIMWNKNVISYDKDKQDN